MLYIQAFTHHRPAVTSINAAFSITSLPNISAQKEKPPPGRGGSSET
jgi:hypothetical protein